MREQNWQLPGGLAIRAYPADRPCGRGVMRRRKRLRKKLHRKFLTTVCAYVVTFDDELRRRLLASEPGTPFKIGAGRSRGIGRLMRRWGLGYWVTVARKMSPVDVVVLFWAEEFPVVRDEAFIFSLESSA